MTNFLYHYKSCICIYRMYFNPFTVTFFWFSQCFIFGTSPSGRLLILFNPVPKVFDGFLALWYDKMFQAHLTHFFSQTWNWPFPHHPGLSFCLLVCFLEKAMFWTLPTSLFFLFYLGTLTKKQRSAVVQRGDIECQPAAIWWWQVGRSDTKEGHVQQNSVP